MRGDRVPVHKSIAELAARIGRANFVAVCLDLLSGAPRERYVEELRALTGHSWNDRDLVFDREVWADYWVRTWGARGLLHVWEDEATNAIVDGLADDHYRPAEMCLKVATRHEVAGTGDGAARLAVHELPRVRLQALRCLAVNGDVEHLAIVRSAAFDSDPNVRRQAKQALETLLERLGL